MKSIKSSPKVKESQLIHVG